MRLTPPMFLLYWSIKYSKAAEFQWASSQQFTFMLLLNQLALCCDNLWPVWLNYCHLSCDQLVWCGGQSVVTCATNSLLQVAQFQDRTVLIYVGMHCSCGWHSNSAMMLQQPKISIVVYQPDESWPSRPQKSHQDPDQHWLPQLLGTVPFVHNRSAACW